jgi:hypothetical protein
LSRRKGRKLRSGAGGRRPKASTDRHVEIIDPELLAGRERYFEFFVIAALFAFGFYNSVLYFGHKVVPISDFPDLFRVGRDILSFKMPTRFKQAPVLGMLQYILSLFVGSESAGQRALTAGWLLNAILYPFNLILLWLVGKRIVGKSALWLAIIAIINPWVIYMLTEPIVETTLLFFTLITFYFMFRRSKWCYLFASITTMVRYEGATLILAAFVMDMIYGKDRRERIRAFAYSAAACVPLAFWMLATVLTWKSGTTHYLDVFFKKDYAKAFAESTQGRTGLWLHMRLLWDVGFRPLFRSIAETEAIGMRPTAAQSQSINTFFGFSQVFAGAGFAFGLVYGLVRRNWNILALLIFFVPYFILHAFYPYPLQRFHTSIFWIAMLLCWFGWRSLWKLIDGNGRVPRVVVLMLQALVVIISIIWLVQLVGHLPEISPDSPTSTFLPYIAITLVVLIFAGRIYVYRVAHFLRELSILAVLCLIIVSNQFSLVSLVRDGQREKEFKQLAEWYLEHAGPGEKLGVYMAGIVRMFAPERAEDIVGLPGADSPQGFVQACYEQDITYVVWATREGTTRQHTGYNRLKLDQNIGFLREARDAGPYEFVERVGWERGWVHIFRLRRPAGYVKPPPPAASPQ